MLDPRLRQLHDEPRSGGNQSAHQRMINRRFNDRASCFAQRRLYCEGNAKKGGEDFLRLLLETANIRVPEKMPSRFRVDRPSAFPKSVGVFDCREPVFVPVGVE